MDNASVARNAVVCGRDAEMATSVKGARAAKRRGPLGEMRVQVWSKTSASKPATHLALRRVSADQEGQHLGVAVSCRKVHLGMCDDPGVGSERVVRGG